MKLIVGLGNPGSRYERTRHNLGFRVVEELARIFEAHWSESARLHVQLAEAHVGREKVVLIEPRTFMNLSGDAVSAVVRRFRIPPENVWVIHDDIDLAFGKVKVHLGRSSAGHRGVQNIIDSLGTNNFVRFRIGIDGRSGKQQPDKTDAYVMARFTQEDEEKLKTFIPQLARLVIEAIKISPDKAISRWPNSYSPVIR